MKKNNYFLSTISTLLLILSINVASAIDAKFEYSTLSDEQFESLISIKKSFSKIEHFLKYKKLTSEQASAAKSYIILQEQSEMSEQIAVDILRNLVDHCEQDQQCREKTLVDEHSGIFSFINIVWFFASVLIIIGVIAVIVLYKRTIYRILNPLYTILAKMLSVVVPALVSFFRKIPFLIYELTALAFALLIVYSAQFFSEAAKIYVVFIGNFLVVIILSFITKHYSHVLKNYNAELFSKIRRWPKRILMSFACLLWASTAVLYNSQLLGFFTVAIILSWLGFGIMITSLEYRIGFKDGKTIFRGTLGAFILLVIYLVINIGQFNLIYYSYFETGIKYLGSFVFYTGLLISSSKWVCNYYKTNYLVLQIITIMSGIAALYIGSVYNLSELRGIGGTFFVLYLIEKQFELSWNKKRAAWLIFLLGLTLFGIAHIVSVYPEFFFMAEQVEF